MTAQQTLKTSAAVVRWIKAQHVKGLPLRFADRRGFIAVSCGWSPAGASQCPANLINGRYAWFGMNYVLRGRGVYRAGHGLEYPIRPGSLFCRLPGRRHTTRIDMTIAYAEVGFALDARTFRLLRDLGVVHPAPVVRQIGLNPGILSDIEEYAHCVRSTDPNESSLKLLAFGRLATSLYARGDRRQPPSLSEHMRLIENAKAILASDLSRPMSMPAVAEKLGVGYELLRKLFRQTTGISMRTYQSRMRAELACELLLAGTAAKAVAERLSFGSIHAYSAWFRRETGISPRGYERLLGANEEPG